MRILLMTYSTTDACSFYRAGGVFPFLKNISTEIQVDTRSWNELELHWQRIIEYDLIFMQRPFSSQALSFCEFMKNFQIPVWADYDDYLLGVPVENQYAKVYSGINRENVKAILKLADIVTVATPALKELYSEYNKNIIVIPNAFNDFIFNPQRALGEQSKIVMWRGTASHIFDVMSHSQSIDKFTEEFPDWKFLFLGFYPWYLNANKNMFSQDELDPILYFNHLKDVRPSIMHVPLFDNQFNRGKSNIALIEGAFGGAVTIAPKWPEWTVPGALNYSTTEEYYDLMKAALRGGFDLKARAQETWDYVRGTLRLSQVNKLRMDILTGI